MSIRALLFHPLGPALILALGGLLVALSRWVIPDPLFAPEAESRAPGLVISRRAGLVLRRPRGAEVGPVLRVTLAVAVVLGALAFLLFLRTRAPDASLSWTWQPLTVAGASLRWETDGWNLLAALLVLLLTLTALALGELDETLALDRRRLGRDADRTLWLGAAALAFVCSGNVVTMVSCWVGLDIALALRLRPGEAAEPSGRAWSLLSLAGVALVGIMALLGEPGVRSSLLVGSFSVPVLGLLWLVALVRAGAYPFHFWVVGPGRADSGARAALHLVAPAGGLWLLGRLTGSGADWLRRPEWAALGVLALLGTALVAWAVESEGVRWRWVVLNRASMAVLAAHMAATAGPQAQMWLLVAFALGGALLILGMALRTRWGWRLPLIAAALAIWGVPGTPGFLARLVLVFPTELPVAVPLFGMVVVAEVLLVAALWRLSVEARYGVGEEQEGATLPAGVRWPTAAELGLAFLMLLVSLVLAGVFPQRLGALVGFSDSDALPALSWTLAHARRSVWIGLALSGAGGLALGLLRRRIFWQMRGWQEGIVAVASLEWLYRALVAGLAWLGAGFRYFASLGEGEGYIGWLLVAAAVLWLLLQG